MRHIILRGPLGVGKTTCAKAIAEMNGGAYVSIDDILDRHGLDKAIEGEGIPLGNFLQANEFVAAEARRAEGEGTFVIVDGNFYHREQLDHLVGLLGEDTLVVTLMAPVETCVARDALRAKPHGEDAARAVHMFVSAFDAGTVIETGDVDVEATIRAILQAQEEFWSRRAIDWMKQQKTNLIERFCHDIAEESDEFLVTIFMAGSPGAGKTEVSKELMKLFGKKPVRIDADEMRCLCPGYTGDNAHVFQQAANKGVNMLYDYVLQSNYNVILDGTFAYAGAIENVQRSIDKGRKVLLAYVYQDPVVAWDFTKKREALQRRRVSKEVFVEGFLKSQERVREAKRHFGDRLSLTMFIKDHEKDIELTQINIPDIDPYLPKVYSRKELERIIL
jgi:predicted kinase